MSKFFGLSKVHHLFLFLCISWEEIGYEVMLVLFYGEFYMLYYMVMRKVISNESQPTG